MERQQSDHIGVVAGWELFVRSAELTDILVRRAETWGPGVVLRMLFISEARMYVPGHRWTTLILVAIMASTLGCRGSRPFGRVVQVTQESDTDFPEIEAPRQRLATAKPREVSSPLARQRPAGSPHVTQTAGVRAPQAKSAGLASVSDDADPRLAATQKTSTRPIASTVSTISRPSTTDTATGPAARSLTDKATAPSRQSVAKKPTPTSDLENPAAMDPAELMTAFSDYPPEVQREALRRLVAATSKSADRTTQPNALNSELAKNVLNLPELPAKKDGAPEIPPTRIASKSSAPQPAVASITDAKGDTERAVQGSVTDLVTTELESTAVQTISDTVEDDGSEVKTASAARDAGDESMVARASIEPSAGTASPEDAAKPATDQLTDKALFASLLKRLSSAKPGESEAERSGRLIRLRHMMVLAGDPDAAVAKIEGMSEAEQEFLRHQLLGLWTMIDPDGHPVPSRRFTTALPQIREAAKFAAAATDSLEVRSLAFCTEIESYGQIKPFSGNRFDAGQQVILYCEIENFVVNKVEGGFGTHLQGSYDIYDSDNEKVVSQLLPADEQVSTNYLRDYFIAYQMHLPQQLSAGTYRLQLTMEDVHGKKYGQASIPFEIAK